MVNNLSKEDTNDTGDQSNNGNKWVFSIILGFIFAILSSPMAYMLTNKINVSLGAIETTNGYGPTLAGLLLHTLFFIIIIRLLLIPL